MAVWKLTRAESSLVTGGPLLPPRPPPRRPPAATAAAPQPGAAPPRPPRAVAETPKTLLNESTDALQRAESAAVDVAVNAGSFARASSNLARFAFSAESA